MTKAWGRNDHTGGRNDRDEVVRGRSDRDKVVWGRNDRLPFVCLRSHFLLAGPRAIMWLC